MSNFLHLILLAKSVLIVPTGNQIVLVGVLLDGINQKINIKTFVKSFSLRISKLE
jgi:hypothetical protein